MEIIENKFLGLSIKNYAAAVFCACMKIAALKEIGNYLLNSYEQVISREPFIKLKPTPVQYISPETP
jgi:hypothetical protein